MKKSNLKVGLFALALVATFSLQQTVSALTLGQGFNLKAPVNTNDNAQVLAAETIEPSASTENQESSNQKPADVIVEVVKGDNLSKIAKAHDTTYKRIFNANESIKDPNIINPGDKLRIPRPDEVLTERPLPQPIKAVQISKPKSKTTAAPKKRIANNTSAPAVANGSVWDSLARCESGGNWSINTGNGYYGGLQFTASTWRAVGGSGLPHQNSREEQIRRAEILLARSGWGQWPACTKKLGLR